MFVPAGTQFLESGTASCLVVSVIGDKLPFMRLELLCWRHRSPEPNGMNLQPVEFYVCVAR